MAVPAESCPARRSICGPSAATRIGGGVTPGGGVRAKLRMRKSWPVKSTVCPLKRAARHVRYSRLCRIGREKSKPNCPSIDTRWLRPIPRTNRPPVAAWAVSACWAITTGCRVNVGTTNVPSSRRFVRAPPSARAIAASKPRDEMFGIQTA